MRDKFDLSESLKILIINDHMFDYFELTGKTLLTVSDEITEAAQSALRTFYERHGYKTVQKPMQKSNSKVLSTSMQKSW